MQGGEGARDGADRAQGRGAASGIMAEPDGRSSATADAERRLQRARQEEAARQFSALLGEVVRDADGDWRDWEQRLRRDPLGRGSSRDMTDRERRDMFSAHVAELRCVDVAIWPTHMYSCNEAVDAELHSVTPVRLP